MAGHDIIVVGASAGGVEALVEVVSRLPVRLPAAVFIVLHIPTHIPSLLPEILSRAGPLVAHHPEDGEKIKYGHIYVAPPDYHLLVEREHVSVTHGPRENRHRPAVDPLFRSAARAYGPRVVGVVLSGALDDGTAGLLAVKRRGGVAVIQDPESALYPSMPQSALEHVEVDYCLPVSEIGPLLARLAHEPVKEEEVSPVPEDMEMETGLAEMDMESLNGEKHVGTPSAFSCPECSGVLWEIQDGELTRYRCRVGHAYSFESMVAEQSDKVEEALWAALRALEENASLSRRIINRAHQNGQERIARNFAEKLQQAEHHAAVIRQLLDHE
jgi:two-component system, chemotaxis family, protein-glutamate methylesterase/glutaminase